MTADVAGSLVLWGGPEILIFVLGNTKFSWLWKLRGENAKLGGGGGGEQCPRVLKLDVRYLI